jgi:hypothetical protein
MCESSEVMKVSEAIPTSQGQTDSLNSGIMDVAMSQADLSNDKTIHDCQILMGVSDIFQEMNDMAIKLNPTQQEISAKKVVNSHLFVPMKNASGLAAGNLSPGTPNESIPELASLNSAMNQEVDYKMCVTMEEKEDDLVKSAVNQEVDYQMCVTVDEKENDLVSTKKTNATNIPSKTRQSARIQDANVHTLKKAIARKANAKGITSSSMPPSSNSSCSLDLLARVCGFSLGFDESTRITNISLIQAKEEALLALQNTKQKLSSISESSREDTQGDRPIDESSLTRQNDDLELSGKEAIMGSNLLIIDQG